MVKETSIFRDTFLQVMANKFAHVKKANECINLRNVAYKAKFSAL